MAAFDDATRLAGYSSWGLAADLSLKPDLGAPGSGILSTYPLSRGMYARSWGTSMASPHVAGAVALMLQERPGLTPAEVQARLQNTAAPLQSGRSGMTSTLEAVHRQGAGFIQVDAAIATDTVVSPGEISAGESADGPHTATLTISNTGGTNATWAVTHVDAVASRASDVAGGTQDTLTFTAPAARVTFDKANVTVPARGTTTLRVTVDAPASATAGTTYGGYVVLTSSTGEVRRVPFAGMAGDYGAMDLLPSAAKGLPTLVQVQCDNLWAGFCYQSPTPTWTPAGAGQAYHREDLPAVALRLAYPVRSLQMSVLRVGAQGQPVEGSRVIHVQSGPMGRSADEVILVWNGRTGPWSATDAAAGTYVLRVAATAPDGDGRVQEWTSPSFAWSADPAPSPSPSPTPSPTLTPDPTPTPTAQPTSTAPSSPSPMPSVSPSPSAVPSPPAPSASPTPSPSRSATGSPTPTATRTVATRQFERTAPYTKAGTHLYNGRQWFTACEPYSATERCRTDIWATVVVIEDGGFVRRNGWAFNNLTYLPLMTRAAWGANPLANHDADGFASGGRQWQTECDTACTGRGACRSYTLTTVYSATPRATGGYDFGQRNEWVFNNIVMFG